MNPSGYPGPSRRQFLASAAACAALAPSDLSATRATQTRAAALHARLKLDLDRRLGTVDPRIYGNFVEHLGRCIYGGIYDEGSPLSTPEGFRRDVLEAARRMRVTQLRWPGGNFASGYHWRDAIGPKSARPVRYDLAWLETETNRFGTDEFLAYARQLGTEPYLCFNMGNGTMEEALAWLEYCNGTVGEFADLRRRNGHSEPYGVKLWGLGNELWGEWQIGHKTAAEYARLAQEWARVLKARDPQIQLVLCGNGDPDWDLPALEAAVHEVDYISAHYYVVVEDFGNDYYEVLGSIAALERVMRNSVMVADMVSARAHKKVPVRTALDEWNVVYRWESGAKRDDVHKLEFSYNLRDALWVASALNLIHRNCTDVRLANLAQLVNVIAPMLSSPTGLLMETIYYPLELYANHAGPVVLEVANDSPKFSSHHFGDQPCLDVIATYDESRRRATLAVVNRHRESDIIASVEFQGFAARPGGRAFLITGDSPDVQNTWSNPRAVTTVPSPLNASGQKWDFRFPPHSITWLEFTVSQI